MVETVDNIFNRYHLNQKSIAFKYLQINILNKKNSEFNELNQEWIREKQDIQMYDDYVQKMKKSNSNQNYYAKENIPNQNGLGWKNIYQQ